MEIRRRRTKQGKRRSSSEYRRSSVRASGKNSSSPIINILAIILPIAAFAAVVYLFIGTELRDRLTSNLFTETGLSLSCVGEDYNEHGVNISPDAKASEYAAETMNPEEQSSIKVSLPRLTLYMIQMGVYSTQENAAEQATALKQMGAAGYICSDNGSYRVIAAAYKTREEAQNVSDRLNGEGYSNTLYNVSYNGAELLITASDDMLSKLKTAFDQIDELLDSIDRASLDFDAENRSVEYEVTLLNQLKTETQAAASGIYACAESNDMMLYVYSFLRDSADEIATVSFSGGERSEFSSLLKSLRINIAMRYAQLLKQLNN